MNPRFINVQDASAPLQQSQHLNSILLAQHEAAFLIGLDGNLLGHSVAEAQLVFHDGLHLLDGDLDVLPSPDLLDHCLGLDDGDAVLKHVPDDPLDSLSDFSSLLLLDLHQLDLLWITVRFDHKLAY